MPPANAGQIGGDNGRLSKGFCARPSGVSWVWCAIFVSAKRHERVRAAAAWICLLAVTLLYAPLAGAAWQARNMDCCAAGFCPMTAHHHRKQQQAPARHSSPMDCGHDMGGDDGMTACSISCCQIPVHPALIPGTFLLTKISFAPARVEVSRPVQVANLFAMSRFVSPLSPPPKSAIEVL